MGLFSKIKDSLAKVQQENRENSREKTAPKEIFDRLREKLEETQRKQQQRKGSAKKQSKGSIFSQLMKTFDEAKQENAASKKEETADAKILDRIQKEMEAIKKDKKVRVETKPTDAPDWGSPSGVPAQDDILGRILAGAHKEQLEKKVEPEKVEDFGSIFDSIMKSDQPKASRSTKKSAPKVEKKPSFGDVFDQLMQEEKAAKKPKKSSTMSLHVGGSALVDGKGGSLAIRTAPKMSAPTLANRLPDNVNVRLLDYTDRNKINIDGQTSGWYQVDYQGVQGWVLELYLE